MKKYVDLYINYMLSSVIFKLIFMFFLISMTRKCSLWFLWLLVMLFQKETFKFVVLFFFFSWQKISLHLRSWLTWKWQPEISWREEYGEHKQGGCIPVSRRQICDAKTGWAKKRRCITESANHKGKNNWPRTCWLMLL